MIASAASPSPPACSRVARTTEQSDDWAFRPIRTVTKLILASRGLLSKSLVYNGFHDSRRNGVDRGARMPSATDRRLSQQFLGKLPGAELCALEYQIEWLKYQIC